jgi:hypothetical protein
VLLTRPVDLPQLDRLISIVEHTPPSEDDEPLSPANYLDLRDSQSFDRVSAYHAVSLGLTAQGDPEQVPGIRASANLFDTLGVAPAVGRTFSPDEEQPGKDRVVILSDGFWRRKFGADPIALGHILKLDEQPYTIIGVMPPHFSFPHGGQNFWIPLALMARKKTSAGSNRSPWRVISGAARDSSRRARKPRRSGGGWSSSIFQFRSAAL